MHESKNRKLIIKSHSDPSVVLAVLEYLSTGHIYIDQYNAIEVRWFQVETEYLGDRVCELLRYPGVD
jgi:hypothetical protein